MGYMRDCNVIIRPQLKPSVFRYSVNTLTKSTIINSQGDVTLATYEMLQCWYSGTADKRVAWEKLTEALKKASLNFLINDVFITEVIDIHILTASKYAYFYFQNLKLK